MRKAKAVIASLACLALAACPGDKTPTTPVAVLTTIVVTVIPSIITVGQIAQASATGLDQNGAAIATGTVTWSTGSASVATVNAAGAVVAVGAGQTQIVATAGSKQGQQSITVAPAPVANVVVAPPTATIPIGGTQQFTATAQDAFGGTLSGRVITWSSSDQTKVTVSTTGLATAVATGTANIIATSEGKNGSAAVTVSPPPVATVTLNQTAAPLTVGATLQLTATALDATGATLSGRVFAWSSSNPAAVTVSAAANVATLTGAGVGTSTITVTSEGKSTTALITVSATSPLTVTVLTITPATLVPGATATIGGTGFGATPALNTVTVDGFAATVLTASATQLTITVPPTIPCNPVHSAPVKVVVGANSGTMSQSLRPGTLRTLAIGASLVITNPAELACTELPSGTARYVMTVVNTSQAPTSVTSFRLQGSFSVPSASANAPTLTLRQSPADPSSVTPVRAIAGLRQPSGDMHARILEMNREAYPAVHAAFNARKQALADARASSSRVGAPPPAPSTAALPTIGSTKKFRVNQFTTVVGAVGSCASFVEVTARAVYIGSKSIIWEDVAAPLAGTVDSYFIRVGQEFDATMYTSDLTYFGDPLITDAVTDNDQHLDMVFTPSIPTGVAGFVTSCDLAPRDLVNNTSSNFGEYFYAFVPTAAGTGFTTGTADEWLREIRTTIVHEVKHIAAIGAHLVNNAPTFEESWLEEGMARHAEEIWMRNNIYRVLWKSNITYASSLFCDVRPNTPACAGTPFGVFVHFQTLYTFLDQQGTFSLFGRVANGDFNFYASSWSFVRWALDRYGAGEAPFLTAITNSFTRTGTANIAAQTGRPVDEMLGNWSLTFFADENAAFAGNADVNFPTWNIRNIYSSMNGDFPTNFPKTFPLVPQAIAKGNFAIDNNGIHAGSFSMYDLTGNAPLGQTIGIVALGGAGAASSSLRIAIARVQ